MLFRSDLMILGLNPEFALNVLGPNVASARFVTPDEDITLNFHCHVATHEKMGMAGRLIVGRGGTKVAQGTPVATPVQATPGQASAAPQSFSGTGTVIAAVPRVNRLIVNHGEIKGFMPAMEMSYAARPGVIDGLNPGDKIEFTIDGATSTVTAAKVIGK